MSDSAAVGTEEQRKGRRTLTLLTVPIIALVILNTVGDALAVRLVNHHPLLLIAMNARNRNLVLVTNHVGWVGYYVVGTLRLLVSDPLFFLIGFWYGEQALRWMETRTRTFGKTLRQWEGWYSKAAYPLVFIAPNNFICLFAGASGMSVPSFFAVNVSGTIARLYAIRWLGEAFDRPIQSVLDFINRYQTPLLIASIVIAIAWGVNELRTGRSDLKDLEEMIDEEPPGLDGDVDADTDAEG
jgi:membrane protein DedA with SNARE-associated domain